MNYLKIDDGMECYSDQHAFITLKDHKDNFKNNPKCRLVNPSKSGVGRISKGYLSNIKYSSTKVLKRTFNIGRENWVEPVKKYTTSNQLV